MLTVATEKQFGTADRQRGNQIEMLERVEFIDVGRLGFNAHADGSSGSTYAIAVDFRQLDRSRLGVHCDCPRFRERGHCKHLWAALSKYDVLYDSPLARSNRLVLYPVGPGRLDCGEPVAHLLMSLRSEDSPPDRELRVRTRRPEKRPAKKPAKAAWQMKLDRVAETAIGQSQATVGVPAEFFPDSFCSTQHWFVLSLSDSSNATAMQLVLMKSVRKNDGEWGRPTAVELDSAAIQSLSDARERRALSLLRPVDEASSYGGYGYRSGKRLYSVRPTIVGETIEALFDTGRLAWKLGDSRQHFEDARPIDTIACDEASSFRLSITRDHDDPSKIVVVPQLRVPGHGLVGIEQLMWSSRIGVGLILLDSATDERDGCDSDPTSAEPVVRTCMIRLPQADREVAQAWHDTWKLVVPETDLESLLATLSESHGPFELQSDETLRRGGDAERPSATCRLEQSQPKSNRFAVSLTATYSDREFAFDSPTRWWYDPDRQQICYRNWDEERRWLAAVSLSEFELGYGWSGQILELPPDHFLTVVESFREAGWNVVAHGAPIRVATDFDIHVRSSVDWFELDAEASFDDSRVSLPTLLKAYENGQRAVVLDDGTLGVLPEQWLNKFGGVQETGQLDDGSIRFHRSQGLLLDLLLEEHSEVQRDRDFTKFLRDLAGFEGIEPAQPPKSFAGTLRDYQRIGLGWLRFLQRFGFGGCLADEMGLGKTVQVLAHLESRRKRRTAKGQKRKPSIIVAPKSLIFNWLDEAQRFTPKLRVRNHTGSDRNVDWDRLAEQPDSIDVLLTTYATMRNDVANLRTIEFDYAILDEAQAIKNPKSQVARAARLLVAEQRLAMTGTPIENHLGDLWSLFDFLNPGMLQGQQSGSSGLPDMQDADQRRRIEAIGKSLKPFILRRTKSEVLTELPEKVEQTLACPMSKPQRKLYHELRDHYRVQLSEKVNKLGLNKAKIHVLEALLRLRQAACDPRLVDPDCQVRGAKIDELLERLDELRQDGGKALVFSQFTSLLGLVRQDLDARRWSYDYLDGRTRNRAEKVKRFQEDPNCHFFLISLKAGGSGLNLTAAEYVFILDPWWNPAVEAQAIDRAHRLGQTHSVNAYRMICSETVEEKIIELQRSKQELADAIVSQNKSLIGKLTAEDLQELMG